MLCAKATGALPKTACGWTCLEITIDYMKNLLEKDGFEKVTLEEVKIPKKWIRGQESLTLFEPRPFPTKLPMIGLGLSVGGNVTGEVVMVHSFEELEKLGEEKIKGKIVFFNQQWVKYGETVKFRIKGASMAAKYGAIGSLIRSVATNDSINSPHTGVVRYDPNYPKIPAAATSPEIADMLSRMIKRGQTVMLNLYMEAYFIEGDFKSHNVMGQITGSEYPNDILLLGGHIDTWDTGAQTGANDDTAGFMVCYEAVRLLLKKGLRPKRTIRFIAWSGEEMGQPTAGAPTYANDHNADEHVVAFESDEGTLKLTGWGFTGSDKGYRFVKTLAERYLSEYGLGFVRREQDTMTDVIPLYERGVPAMRNIVADTENYDKYFTSHHSAIDSMAVLSPDDMDSNVIGIASLFYILADVPERLPRD